MDISSLIFSETESCNEVEMSYHFRAEIKSLQMTFKTKPPTNVHGGVEVDYVGSLTPRNLPPRQLGSVLRVRFEGPVLGEEGVEERDSWASFAPEDDGSGGRVCLEGQSLLA